MMMLFVFGLLLIAAPIVAFCRETDILGTERDAGMEWLQWLATKPIETMMLWVGSIYAGVIVCGIALAQSVWMR
jgi:hypothetical protein